MNCCDPFNRMLCLKWWECVNNNAAHQCGKHIDSIKFATCHHSTHSNIMKRCVWAWVLIKSSSALVLFHNLGALNDIFFLFFMITILITQVCALCFHFCEQEKCYQTGTGTWFGYNPSSHKDRWIYFSTKFSPNNKMCVVWLMNRSFGSRFMQWVFIEF